MLDRAVVDRQFLIGARAVGVNVDACELRFGEWQIDLPAATARAVLSGTVLTAALAALHEASIPAAVLSVVVPFVFDLDRVRLNASDRYIFALLLRNRYDRKAIDDLVSRAAATRKGRGQPA